MLDGRRQGGETEAEHCIDQGSPHGALRPPGRVAVEMAPRLYIAKKNNKLEKKKLTSLLLYG